MLPWIFRPSNWKLSFRILPTALALVIHTVCIDCIFAMSCAEPITYPIIVHQMLYVSGSGINTNFRHQFKNRMEIDAIHFPMIIDVWTEFDAKKFKKDTRANLFWNISQIVIRNSPKSSIYSKIQFSKYYVFMSSRMS